MKINWEIISALVVQKSWNAEILFDWDPVLRTPTLRLANPAASKQRIKNLAD